MTKISLYKINITTLTGENYIISDWTSFNFGMDTCHPYVSFSLTRKASDAIDSP
jgi:hypothetical protein